MKKRKVIPGQLLALLLPAMLGAQTITDMAATKETRNLYGNLHVLSRNYTLFGHQDDLAYGVGWKYIKGKSDVHDIVNDYPGVYGWDIARLELDSSRNIDGVPFSKMKEYIRQGYDRGAVITISWHFNNPLTSGSAWDTTHGAVAAVLPGGAKHALYLTWLDKAASFMHSLQGSRKEKIPLLFRPFHELTGNWFWWCRNTCSADDFKKLWRFTIDYLRNKKMVHQLIVVYNTAGFANEEDYLERYPGDEWVDMVSFDLYQSETHTRQGFIDTMRYEIKELVAIAAKKNKPAALAETGYEAIPDAAWWTKTLLPALEGFPLSYVLVWRNAGYMPSWKKMHYYAPYKGQVSAADFKNFYSAPTILFEKGIRAKQIYK